MQIPVLPQEVGSFPMCNRRHSNLNVNIQHQLITLGKQKKDNTNISWVSYSFISLMAKTMSTPKLRFSHTSFSLALSLFLFLTDASKKSRSSFHRPARPQSETWTGWLHER